MRNCGVMDEPNKVTEQESGAPAPAPNEAAPPPASAERAEPDMANAGQGNAGQGPAEPGAPAPVDEPIGDAADRAQMPPSPAEPYTDDGRGPDPELPSQPETPTEQLDQQPPPVEETSATELPPTEPSADPAAAEPAEMPADPEQLGNQIVAESVGERVEAPSAEEQRGDAKPGTPPEAPVDLPGEPSPPAATEEQQSPPAEAVAEAPVEPTKEPVQPPAAEKPSSEKPPAKKEESADAEQQETEEPAPKSENMDWYILKVQSNRETSIRDALLRRIKIAGLDYFFGDVIIPTEKVTEVKGGKKRVVKRKLYPGYLVAHMEINDDTWFLVRETPGIGDFTGATGHPTPMLPHEVEAILAKSEEKQEEQPKLQIGFTPGDRVKINDGTFENFEGDVEGIDATNGQVTVIINIFGRSTPVTLGYWQIEKL